MPGRLNALEVRDLVRIYDTGVRALDGLTFHVPAGSIFGFLGLNGAGKTTTIRILAGLLKQDSGTMKLFGTPLGNHAASLKRDLGFVLDDPLYFGWMTGLQYLRFVGAMYGIPGHEAARRSGELLGFFDLEGKENDPIDSFSTGMKKKISLAAAIIHGPKLLVLDEPLEGIDALAASAIKETLTSMARRGTTVLITSHVLDTVEKFCTDIGIIHEGRMLLQTGVNGVRSKVKGKLRSSTYASLEELFVDLVSGKAKRKPLSFL